MNEAAWLAATLSAARPRVVGALLRHFRDLELAEDSFQEASVRALERWPRKGAPRDPVAWLVLVARNFAIDGSRRAGRSEPLPPEESAAEPGDPEADLVARIEVADFRDDVLRLLFLCCHPELAAAQQIALALRVVSGLAVKEIARSFLVTESAMEQRITRAKRTIAQHPLPLEAPGEDERRRRLGTVSAVLYLLFNEGYSASGGDAQVRAPLCDEAIRLARLLVSLFPSNGEVLALNALFSLQHSRTPARLTSEGEIALLDAQDRTRWDRELIAEGLALLEKARFHGGAAGPYALQASIAAAHARAALPEHTDWREIERSYAELERLQPSPVIRLNRAVAVARVRGAEEALVLLEPLAGQLARYFHFHGARGALLRDLGRVDEARAALARALTLANTLQEASFIRAQLDSLGALD